MTAKVIQGSFVGAGPRLPSPVAQPKAMPRPPAPAFAGRPPVAQRLVPGPPAPAIAGRPPGPPAPAFAARPPVAQLHGAGNAFAVEAGQVGLLAGGGRPLPEAVRGKMESALGADFSNVRVHVGPQAERIGAIAFTLGTDIYFAPGRFQPNTAHGQQLLGHELAHVVQQRQGRVRNPLGSGVAVVQDHALEAEADRLGQRAVTHQVAVQAKMPPGMAQAAVAVSISAPISAGRDYRLAGGVDWPMPAATRTLPSQPPVNRPVRSGSAARSAPPHPPPAIQRMEDDEDHFGVPRRYRPPPAPTLWDWVAGPLKQAEEARRRRWQAEQGYALHEARLARAEQNRQKQEKMHRPKRRRKEGYALHEARLARTEQNRQKDADIAVREERKAKWEWQQAENELQTLAKAANNWRPDSEAITKEIKNAYAVLRSNPSSAQLSEAIRRLTNARPLEIISVPNADRFADEHPGAVRIKPQDKITEALRDSVFSDVQSFVASTFQKESRNLPPFEGYTVYHDTKGVGQGGTTLFGIMVGDDKFLIALGKHHATKKDVYKITHLCTTTDPVWQSGEVKFG